MIKKSAIILGKSYEIKELIIDVSISWVAWKILDFLWGIMYEKYSIVNMGLEWGSMCLVVLTIFFVIEIFFERGIFNPLVFSVFDKNITISKAAELITKATNRTDQDFFWRNDGESDEIPTIRNIGIKRQVQKGLYKLYGTFAFSDRFEPIAIKDIKNCYFDEDYRNLYDDAELKHLRYKNVLIKRSELLNFVKNQRKLPESERSIVFYQ